MPPEKIDSLADDVKPLVLGLLRQISGLTARVDELRQTAEDAGQLFAATVARSEGERRGADEGEESPQRSSWRGASARRKPGRDTRHLRRALRVRRRARRGRSGTREGLGPCRSAAQ